VFERAFGILLVTLLLVTVTGCSRSDREHSEIRQTLMIRDGALNARDVSRYISVISRQYNYNGKNFIRLKECVEKNFRDFELISYKAGTPSINLNGTSAETVGSYRMKIRVRGKDMSLNGTEHFRLVKEPEGWKIIAGI
jgi:hypothetical protein